MKEKMENYIRLAKENNTKIGLILSYIIMPLVLLFSVLLIINGIYWYGTKALFFIWVPIVFGIITYFELWRFKQDIKH